MAEHHLELERQAGDQSHKSGVTRTVSKIFKVPEPQEAIADEDNSGKEVKGQGGQTQSIEGGDHQAMFGGKFQPRRVPCQIRIRDEAIQGLQSLLEIRDFVGERAAYHNIPERQRSNACVVRQEVTWRPAQRLA